MRKIPWALTGLLIVPQVLAQEHDHAKMGGAEKPPMVSASKQGTCPVTGKAAREDVFVQEGRLKVYLSSPDCVAKFKDSPAKHLPNVYKQIYPQTVQVKCLVSGDPVEPMKSVDFIGARIDFCCDQCPEDFKADPAKYLVKMKSASTEQVHCPVTGGPIDPRVSAQYSGKTLYFSSADAMAKFKAAPAKYMERLRPEAGVLARGATADEDLLLCAVAPPEKAVRGRKEVQSTTYRGKTYFLGSDEDVDTFKARPAEYAAAVDETMKAQPRESAQWFTCSMHPEVLQKGPGKCPKCGMDPYSGQEHWRERHAGRACRT
ncbi:MAG: hypothetical protein AMXMBFR13_35460 [Phycisphaerae bacterium]